MPDNTHLLLYCRPGFEKECASEISDKASQAGLTGYIKAKPDSAYITFNFHSENTIDNLNQVFKYRDLIFSRQCIFTFSFIKGLPNDDRISPILNEILNSGLSFSDTYFEVPDTNEGKQLNSFCKKFSTPFLKSLKDNRCMDVQSPWRLHLFFLSSSAVYIGVSHINNRSEFQMGIPRLRMPRSAPSRSTLKLDEAFNTMLNEAEQKKYLQNGMTAVDLGACPGGWTWQLVNRGIRVTAIDNGNMNPELMDTGLVTHIKADGFKYAPENTVDWLVCDMVERPLHISQLMARWLSEEHCRHAVFNLKLPMKQRYKVVQECLELIQSYGTGSKTFKIRARQLYHDREEITCIIL
jgi:23S rRNA (cytidine2498-2'-O)-methyltransferase